MSLNILLKGQLKYIQENDFDVVAISSNGPEIPEITSREGVEHCAVALTRRITPFTDLKALFQLMILIYKRRPVIIHTHTPKAGLLGMIAAKIMRVPYRLHTVAGMPLMEASPISARILKITEYLTYLCATRIYPNSYKLKEWIIGHFSIKADMVKVIGEGSSNGIDTSFFSGENEMLKQQVILIEGELNINEQDLVYVFVGRLVKDKGVSELVQAFLKLNNPKSHLILVGPYEEGRDELPSSIKEIISEAANIHSVGFQTDIRPYLSVADIFVFPSYREGFPNVVLQACSMGLPCIVSDINGCNEVIRHEYNGLLVPSKSVELLYEAMNRLKDDKSLRDLFAGRAREAVRSNFDQVKVWRAILKEYQDAIGGIKNSKNVR